MKMSYRSSKYSKTTKIRYISAKFKQTKQKKQQLTKNYYLDANFCFLSFEHNKKHNWHYTTK